MRCILRLRYEFAAMFVTFVASLILLCKFTLILPGTCLHYLKTVENNNNGAVAGPKRPMINNNGGNRTPSKAPCCQNPAKTVSDVEVDLETLK